MTIAIHMRNGNVRLVILIANAGLLRIYPSTRSFVPNTACLQSSLLALCIRIDNDVFFPETPKDGVANGVIVTYPALFLRIKAMLLDSVLFALLVLTTVICVGSLSIEALPLKATTMRVSASLVFVLARICSCSAASCAWSSSWQQGGRHCWHCSLPANTAVFTIWHQARSCSSRTNRPYRHTISERSVI